MRDRNSSAENAVRNLAGRYARAAMMDDFDGFIDLWDEDGVWVLVGMGEPSIGHANIRRTLERLRGEQDFFVQAFSGGIVEIDADGTTARSHWIVEERARMKDGSPYHTAGTYDDEVVLRDGVWRYARRTYQSIWTDMKTPVGGDLTER